MMFGRSGYQIQPSTPTRRGPCPESPYRSVRRSHSLPRIQLTEPRVFLPAADIPRFVALGSVALGITGQDVIAESTHASMISELLPLGFGKCALQVQVPVTGPIQSVEALSGRRIATSFEVLAGEFFAGVDKRVGEGEKTQVEYVGGSVEAACALGMADGIGLYSPCHGNQFRKLIMMVPACSSRPCR